MKSSTSAVRVRDEFRDFLLRMAGEYSRFPELRQQETALTELASSLVTPFTLAVFGYMKTGKSTLINALVGKPLALTGTEPTTATLNWIIYGDVNQEKSFMIHWKDRCPESKPYTDLLLWAGESPEVLSRIRQISHLQLFACANLIRNIKIVDTPGIGSVTGDHTEVATSLLSAEEGRKADALLYVFPTAAKELDENTLLEFRNKTRLPGSDAYNSIGVLHKWDGLEADDPFSEAQKKACALRERLGDVVCDVIPVSGPLALVARHSPDSFLERLLEVTNRADSADVLIKALKKDTRWNQDEERKRTLEAYPDLPWGSFARVVRLMLANSCESVIKARAICLEASGIERLEQELDRRFFLNAAIIKQRLTRVKALEPIKRGDLYFNERIELLARDERHFRDLVAEIPKGNKHADWLADKHSLMGKERSELEEIAENANRICLAEEERMNLLEKDLEFLEQMDKKPEFVEKSDAEWIRSLLRQDSVSEKSGVIPREVLKSMIDRYQHQLQGPIKPIKELFAHLIRRIQERLRKA
jgi:GTPase SAR1 family protein